MSEEPTIYAPFDSPLRWKIPSRSHPSQDYLIDLGAYQGRGVCQCPHWITTVGPRVKAGEWKTCHHVRVARERFANWAIQAFLRHDLNHEHDKEEVGI